MDPWTELIAAYPERERGETARVVRELAGAYRLQRVEDLARLRPSQIARVLARVWPFDSDAERQSAAATLAERARAIATAAAAGRRPSIDVAAVGTAVRLPAAVRDALAQAKVERPADLFTAAGMTALRALDPGARRRVLAVARLGTAAGNADAATALVDAGITTVTRLARTSAAAVDRLTAGLPAEARRDARALHRRASGAAAVAADASMQFRLAHGRTGSWLPDPPLLDGVVPELLDDVAPTEPQTCAACDDCHHVFSPILYLFDLLDFVADQWQVGSSTLETVLRQEIDGLDCETSQQPIPQVRLAIGVLERHRGSALSDAAWTAAFRSAADRLLQLIGLTSAALGTDPAAAALHTTVTATAPTLQSLEAVEQEVRRRHEQAIAAAHPLPAEPSANATDAVVAAYLLERDRVARDISAAHDAFAENAARVLEPAWMTYRDRLVAASGRTPAQLEDSLFIDLRASPCRITTSLQQVTESLHSFILAVRTGAIESLRQHEPLRTQLAGLNFEGFDTARWQILERYLTWASAMYVFAYPENALFLPTLRRPMSPAFSALAGGLSLSATPGQVAAAAARFDAECDAMAGLIPIDAHLIDRTLYVFGRADTRLFMTTVDTNTRQATGWSEVDRGPSKAFVIGVVPFELEGWRFLVCYGKEETFHRSSLEFRWLLLDGTLIDGPEFEFPETPVSTTIGPLMVERDQAGTPTPHIRVWWQASSGTQASQVHHLTADGTWGAPRTWPATSGGPGAPLAIRHTIVGGRPLRIGVISGARDTVRIHENAGFFGTLPSTPFSVDITVDFHGGDLGYVLLASSATNRTWIVATTLDGHIFCVGCDLGSGAVDEQWVVLAATAERLEASRQAPADAIRDHLYFEERMLHLPLLAAETLNRTGDFAGAHDRLLGLYDPFARENQRERFPFSRLFDDRLERDDAWYSEGLAPHAIARRRSRVYLRHTILAMVKNLIDWADHEFALAEPETVNRARELYLLAERVLQSPPLGNPCEEGLAAVEAAIVQKYRQRADRLFPGWNDLYRNGDRKTISAVTAEMLALTNAPLAELRTKGTKIVSKAARGRNTRESFGDVRSRRERANAAFEDALFSDRMPSFVRLIDPEADVAGRWAAVAAFASGVRPRPVLLELTWLKRQLRGTLSGQPLANVTAAGTTVAFEVPRERLAFSGTVAGDRLTGTFTRARPSGSWSVTFRRTALTLPERVPDLLPPVAFCVPPNPLLAAFGALIDTRLRVLRACRDMTGEPRPIPVPLVGDAGAALLPLTSVAAAGQLVATTDQPRYRYSYLAEIARQRAGLAQQIGSLLLAALKERDQAEYDLLLAGHARELTAAARNLKQLTEREAGTAREIADLQRARADENQTFWNDRIAANPGGLSDMERNALALMSMSGHLQLAASITNFAIALPAAIAAAAGAVTTATSVAAEISTAGAATPAAVPGMVAGSIVLGAAAAAGGAQIAAGLQGLGGTLSTYASEQLTRAGFLRRWEEWTLQNALANHDATIAAAQVALADDRLEIAGQERAIAGLQHAHAMHVATFLQNKRLNRELYEWMVGVLVDQYRTVTQSAVATARLAQAALEFERQEPIRIVAGDYWTVSSSALRDDQRNLGLLGAERLLTDLTRLDDFRLTTERRRLQLTKTISLAQRLPVEFTAFRRSGTLRFDTLLDWFDEDFPGHYMRLIKSVRVSVVALVPPADGIHATLTNLGASTVAFPDRPPQRSLRTYGEEVALDAPFNESGLFVLDYNDPMFLPFEGLGVETRWSLDLPRAANRFAFDSIADVLFTIDYTALADDQYRARVIARMGGTRAVQAVFSLRTNFPDQWYHLHNPQTPASGARVTIPLPRYVFPSQLDPPLRIRHLTIIPVPRVDTPPGLADALTLDVGGVSLAIPAVDATGTYTTASASATGFSDSTFDGRTIDPAGAWHLTLGPLFYAGSPRPIERLFDIVLIPTIEGNVRW